MEIDMIASGTFHTLWKTIGNQLFVSGRVTERSLGPDCINTDVLTPILLDLQDVMAVACNPHLRISYVFKRDELLVWGEYGRKIGKEGRMPHERVVSYPIDILENQICQSVSISAAEGILFVIGFPYLNDHFRFFVQLVNRGKFGDANFLFA
jgi:hypothetical protein